METEVDFAVGEENQVWGLVLGVWSCRALAKIITDDSQKVF
jgi:hypothetical protein